MLNTLWTKVKSMKEIDIKELFKYINPFDLEKEPAIAVADDGKEVNGLTIGWGEYGILWGKLAATVYVHEKRYSKHIFDGAKYYSVSYVKDKEQLHYFGTVSGRDENKMQKYSSYVEKDLAPYFKNSKVVVICRMMGKSSFDVNSVDDKVKDWYNRDGVHTLYYGEIVKVLVS